MNERCNYGLSSYWPHAISNSLVTALSNRLLRIAQPGIGKMLSPIQRYCKNHGLPRLTSIVITEKSGLPGEKFTEDSGPGDIFADQAKVFVYDWFTRKAPTSEDFKEAMQD
jgi:hypothetical protein